MRYSVPCVDSNLHIHGNSLVNESLNEVDVVGVACAPILYGKVSTDMLLMINVSYTGALNINPDHSKLCTIVSEVVHSIRHLLSRVAA